LNLNKLYLIGTLKLDPETRETHSGSSVTRIVLTVYRDYFSKERNQRVREQDSFEVQAWGQLGQQIAQGFKRGSSIMIEGRLKQDTWETPTGERRQRTVVHAENFAPVGARTGAPEGAPVGAEGAAEEGPTPTAGGPGASGKRKRRRRRGPRRDGLPAGPVVPQTPEERAAFSAGITSEAAAAGTNPAPANEVSAPETSPPRQESAPPPSAPAPAPPPPAAEKPKTANVSLKEDMPF
jgi:single-strand DNA-binding protein